MASKKPRKKSKKVSKKTPAKPLTMRQKFMNWLAGAV